MYCIVYFQNLSTVNFQPSSFNVGELTKFTGNLSQLTEIDINRILIRSSDKISEYVRGTGKWDGYEGIAVHLEIPVKLPDELKKGIADTVYEFLGTSNLKKKTKWIEIFDWTGLTMFVVSLNGDLVRT